jgi:hypothetical protein
MTWIIIGFIIGFIYFLYELETPSMGGIIFRLNSHGNKYISFGSLYNILIAPFKYIYFWTNIELLSINWIITSIIGILIILFIKLTVFS